jgi:hypothetical protein
MFISRLFGFRHRPLGAVETVAEPAASEALVRADLASIEACEHSRLLQSIVKAEMPSVGELIDADALLRRVKVTLAPTVRLRDDSCGA